MSALRSITFTCLLEWPEFAAMDYRLADYVTTDFTGKVEKAQAEGDTRSVWDLFQEYMRDITANDTTAPGVLTRYAEILRQQAGRSTS